MPNDSNWFAPMNSANYMSSLQNVPAPRLEQYKPGMSNIQPIPLNQQYKYNEPENKQSGINIPYNFINQMVTGIDTMSNMFGNSKFNAQKRFNNQNIPYQQNKDLYSTNQDLYGVPYAQEGGSIDDLRARYESSKTLSNVAMLDNNYDFANYMAKKSSNLYDEIKSLEQITHDESLRQDILASLPKSSQQEQYIDPYQRRTVSDFDESGYDDNSEGYISPNGIPSPNIGFNAKPSENKTFAFNYLQEQGLAPHQAAGIVGNFAQESNVNPNITNSIGAFGAGQWLGPRKKALFEFAKKTGQNPRNLRTQLDFTIHELNTTEKTAFNALKNTKTSAEAAQVFRKKYERPGEHEANDKRRIQEAFKLHPFEKGGSFYDQLLQQNKPIIDANRPIVNRLSQQPQIDQVIKQQALAKQIANYEKTFSKSQGETPVSKLKAKQLNSSYVYNNPYSQLDENGNIAPIANDRDLQGVPKFGTQAYRTDDGMKNIMHGLDAAMLVEGIGHLGYKGLRNLGEYATTQTPLKNAYKLNPYAFKPNPEAYYRGVGKGGIKDALETGIIKSRDTKLFPSPYFAKPNEFETALYYNPEALIEAKGIDVSKVKNIEPNQLIFRNKDAGAVPLNSEYVDEIYLGNASPGFKQSGLENIPTSNPNIKLLQKDWLKGYKEIPKPKTNFKSEINWSKWNKEIPDNPQLMQEYNAIEQTSKANGTWMKNPDGSIFEGTPEQFVQQNSSNFKKAFPNPILNDVGNVQYNYHGSPNKLTYFDERKAKPSMFGQGVYTSYDKNTGKYYLQNNPEGELYELYINSNKPQNTITRKDFYDYKNKQKNLIEKSRNTSDESLKENIYEEIKKLDKEWGIKYNKNLENQYLNDNSDFLRVGENQVTPFSNYLKSAIGNNGMFDMTNPNIYKALFPAVIGAGALQQKQLGGKINDNNGYLTSNLHNFTPKKIINSNRITTEGMAFPIQANGVNLYPNTGDYIFPTNKVIEKPLYQNGGTYTIKKNDNLSNIAKNYNVSYKELAKLNNISNPDYIQAGQILKVPQMLKGSGSASINNNKSYAEEADKRIAYYKNKSKATGSGTVGGVPINKASGSGTLGGVPINRGNSSGTIGGVPITRGKGSGTLGGVPMNSQPTQQANEIPYYLNPKTLTDIETFGVRETYDPRYAFGKTLQRGNYIESPLEQDVLNYAADKWANNGRPKINYNPKGYLGLRSHFVNNVINLDNKKDLLEELAHSVQYKNKGNYAYNQQAALDKKRFSSPSDSDAIYHNENTLEHEAHSVIAKQMRGEILNKSQKAFINSLPENERIAVQRNLEKYGHSIVTNKTSNQNVVLGINNDNSITAKRFPVITGQSYNTDINVATLNKLSKNKSLRGTPVGDFNLNYRDNIYGVPGYDVDGQGARAIAYHQTYPGEFKKRNALYGKEDPNARRVSYGCINCKKSDLESFYNLYHDITKPLKASIIKKYGGLVNESYQNKKLKTIKKIK